ncbi:MAG: ERCC4 domain-containing protein [Gemmatimonadota bacterium]
MDFDHSALTIGATRPEGPVARGLAGLGVQVAPVAEDEGPVDRYILSPRLAVERRPGPAFPAAIMDKSLFASAVYLHGNYAIPVLVVEGQVNYQYSAMDPRAVRGALSSMVVLYGVTVLSTADVQETVELIAMMARHEQVGVPEISLTPKRKAVGLPDLQRRVVEMLPGCGMVMARELLQAFGSVRRIVNATEEELRQVRGIGRNKAREMVEVLGAEYGDVDTERQFEDAVEIDPSLLFDQPVTLLARQHYLFARGAERHVVDLVFHDPAADEVVLVELKRARLEAAHHEQLCAYLDRARESALLRPYLDGGAGLRGVLATVVEGDLRGCRADITVRVADRERVIDILQRLRRAQREGMTE